MHPKELVWVYRWNHETFGSKKITLFDDVLMSNTNTLAGYQLLKPSIMILISNRSTSCKLDDRLQVLRLSVAEAACRRPDSGLKWNIIRQMEIKIFEYLKHTVTIDDIEFKF